ncbi:neutral/alkaline nonlysosomal ceramidase family protein [Heterostelium album PN500]|uniref:Neutral ceramidase n=1 Tax=Heterostelium pallidum (strain ATCC 26659 / Pp 5 / PN500) TaxID=670386 RepID=D3BAW3_HETP5|nr:neutral/alkaline nonlysosomal ceramidase family protein [Heterostelium album PN500]EFA81700.1 neutral/alkaline nonlysosomal ceramidase family protein [Heterostelium album PN500]|eukprot:XP_020433817.1 neutral/alkaline nonlysosomal ceramidase family protein [Heterostelium album PN500]
MKYILLLTALLVVVSSAVKIQIENNVRLEDNSDFQIGTGIYDITGPAAETGMMGYAMPGQVTGGIHFRLRSRAFVFIDSNGNRAVYVSTDSCMIFQAVKIQVVQLLEEHFGPNVYSHENVLLSGIHTHSGPGGYSMYALYGITTLGFYKESFDAICEGIVQSIIRAHNNVKPGKITAEQSKLYDSNINRSPTAYLNNPAEERALYENDVDKNITLIKMVDTNGSPIGALTFFAVHCTSMNNTNHLISGDNKGYASYAWEKLFNNNSLPGTGPFIAAFGQSNEGDVSPNTLGAFCPDGSRCYAPDSTCNGKNEGCKGIGPGKDGDMFESTQIIGNNQFQKALEMWETASIPVQGSVQYRHTWLPMTNITVYPPFTPTAEPATTCRAAMGYSFAAGTTDGPGAFDFTQGDNNTNGNVFWNFISKFIAKPTEDQKQCQAPKPILIDVGLTKPLPWTPDVVPIQIITIGNIVLCAVPGEFTTMSGRRLRNTVYEILNAQGSGIENPIVLVAGLSNTYSGYIATYEEYEVQRYEAASTIFGPHTLGAYQQEFAKLATSIAQNNQVEPGPFPRNMTGHTFFFLPPVVYDEAPGGNFGAIYQDVGTTYAVNDTVTAVFYGANLRNNFMIESTFLSVDLEVSPNQWETLFVDGSWETKIYWKMHVPEIAQSLITVEWTIPPTISAGTYRITHQGYAKPSMFSDKLVPYSGQSSTFTVTA